MPRAVIITSWIEYPLDIRALLREDDYIVCLDRGYEIAVSQWIQPDLLLGDFDSSRTAPPEGTDIPVLRFPPEKDYTDLELAFRILDPAEYPELLVIGGLGGRLDHTAANLLMLAGYTAADGASPQEGTHLFPRITIRDGRNLCFVLHAQTGAAAVRIHPSLLGAEARDCYFSLFPVNGACSGLSLSGAKYPLENAVLAANSALGTSNEFTDGPAELTLEEGTLLVILTLKEIPKGV